MVLHNCWWWVICVYVHFIPHGFFYSYLFLVGWSLLYNIGLIGHTSAWINHRCMYATSLLNLPLHVPPIPASPGYQRAPVWVPWVRQQIPSLGWCACICAALPVHLTLSLSFPTLVGKSVLYVCISTAAPWTDSSGPSFWSPGFSLSDWLHSV